jgi:hypothetical protein
VRAAQAVAETPAPAAPKKARASSPGDAPKTPRRKTLQRDASLLTTGASIAWTDFARGRHLAPNGKSWFRGTEQDLLALVQGAWASRQPGFGRTGLDKVVVVSIPTDNVVGTTATIRDGVQLHAAVTRRRDLEDPYVGVVADAAPDPVTHAEVVLYNREMLRSDGEKDFTADWGVVSLNASSIKDEPMNPLTMARNMLEKPGGSKATYTAEQFAEAVYYWSQKATVKG